MTAYIFPGQGSQQMNMGKDLFHEFADYVSLTSNIIEMPAIELITKNPENRLNDTRYTQPLLFMVNALMLMSKLSQSPIRPTYVAGHSLGEYSALFAAGAFDFETGLRIVKKRAELMGRVQSGAMAAVLGISASAIKTILDNSEETNVEIANYNTPYQTVISGANARIDHLERIFTEKNARYIKLNVSGAFHSKYMSQIGDEFLCFLKNYKFNKLHTPVISNVTAKPYEDSMIQHLLYQQLTHPVRWVESMEYLEACGENEFIEIGPGRVLTKLLSEIQKERTTIN